MLFNIYKSLFFIFLISSLTSCLEDEEGCLDPNSSNFDATADSQCEDCCTFPTLSFEVNHRFTDSLSFQLGDLYALEDSQIVRPIDIRFYICNIWIENDVSSFSIVDTIDLTLNDGNIVTQVDDYAIIDRNASFQLNIGDIKSTGTFNKIRFTVGLDDIANQTNPLLLDNSHSLAIDDDSMYISEDLGYIFTRFNLVTDTLTNDTILYETNKTHAIEPTEIELDLSLTIDLGFNVTIPIKIDYYEWLKGINFEGNKEDILNAIVNNTTNAFFIDD